MLLQHLSSPRFSLPPTRPHSFRLPSEQNNSQNPISIPAIPIALILPSAPQAAQPCEYRKFHTSNRRWILLSSSVFRLQLHCPCLSSAPAQSYQHTESYKKLPNLIWLDTNPMAQPALSNTNASIIDSPSTAAIHQFFALLHTLTHFPDLQSSPKT